MGISPITTPPSADNVCIDSMSVNISHRTLERCGGNLDTLGQRIREYVCGVCVCVGGVCVLLCC